MAEEQVQTNMALIVFSDSELNLKKRFSNCRRTTSSHIEIMRYFLEKSFIHKREVACKDYEINMLKSEFEKVKHEKEGIEFKIEKFDKASKDLEKLLGSRITDKSKKGLWYNVVPPPHPLIYNRPKNLDLSYSGLDEFKRPEFKSYGSEDSKQESNIVIKKKSDDSKDNSNDSLIKEQVSKDTRSFVDSSLNVEKETVFLDKKIEFVKPKNHEKPVKKSVRYAEMYRSQSPRGNQRNWNGQKSNQLGSDFADVIKQKLVLSVNYNYTTNMTHPNAQRNMVPRAVLMKTGLKPFNTVRTVNTAHPKSIVFSAKPMSCKSGHNAVKTSACWVWRPTKPDSASITMKKYNYINARGRSNCHLNSNAWQHSLSLSSRNLIEVMFTFREKQVGGRISGKGTLKTDSLDFEDNRVLVVKPHNKTPYELFRGFKPALSFMRLFGCHVTILNTLDSLGKFDGKSDEGFFVGYSLSSKAFRVYNTRTRRVEENLRIGFLENKPMIEGNSPKWLFDIDSLTQSMNYVPISVGTISNESACTQEEFNAGTSTQKKEINQDCIMMPIWKDASYFDSPSKDVGNVEPKSVADDQNQVEDGPDNDPEVTTGPFKLNTLDPSVNTASSSDPDSPKDMFTMGASHTLESPTLMLSSSPVIKAELQKLNPQVLLKLYFDSYVEAMQEELLQFKLQQVWILVDLPIGKRAIRTKWVFRNKKDKSFLVYQMDVKSAFLYGTIEEEVYVTQPQGFKDPNHLEKVYKVVKALYGLHQAPRAWYETLANYLLGNGFKRGKIDQTLFIKKQKGRYFAIRLRIMTLLCFYKQGTCNCIEKLMKKRCEVASTTIDLEKPLVKDGDANDVDVYLYRSMNGSLMYLTASRPDIMFAAFGNSSEIHHLTSNAYTMIEEYARATQDRKTTIGGCHFVENRLISWQCKKQTVVATSTTKAEYVAAASCYGQIFLEKVLMLEGFSNVNDIISSP
ncbi:putative ribonuclease H-like domain-containing protein [Tanacetum coccineum]